MSYFSRLTDIVTCNLSEMLSQESEPQFAIQRIIAEMEEGLAGAGRSVATASASVERLQREMEEQHAEMSSWTNRAREELAEGREDQARLALSRKQEIEDVLAGLEQQNEAALATRDHLTTMLRALDARLADARRKQQQLPSSTADEAAPSPLPVGAGQQESSRPADDHRARRIEAELDALKRELGEGD